MNRTICDEQFLEKETLLKLLKTQVESYSRLLKDLEIKKYEQTGVREEERSKWAHKEDLNKILKLEEIEDENESKLEVGRPSENNRSFASKR